ncbi:MAG: asparaginase [Pseudomonadota bacterium]
MAEVTRGTIDGAAFVECTHRGHAVVSDGQGIVAAWGDPQALVLPRSSAKMIQALPLVESGAAAAARLGPAQLALACASHNGAAIHTDPVAAWLSALGLREEDLRCGPQTPRDPAARAALLQSGRAPGQIYNNCSGKHAGFLTLTRHLGAGPDYVDPDHPVQRAVRAAWEDATGALSPGHAIDGCSAPNFAGRLADFAHAMARFARPRAAFSGARAEAAEALVAAMIAHPALVAGEERACTALMRAAQGRAAVKTGAEGVFFAILPGRGLGVALKIVDGATRAADAAMAALLVRLGAVEPGAVRATSHAPQVNRRGIVTGEIRPAAGFFQNGAPL